MKGVLDGLKALLRDGRMHPRAVFQFFRAGSDGNTLLLFDAGGRESTRFTFPRQARDGGVCLADFAAPLHKGRPRDNVCLFVVTAGAGIRELQ